MLQKQLGKDIVALMSRAYGDCSACGKTSENHAFWELASVRSQDPESQIQALENAIADRDWARASRVREFRGAEDAIVFVFLKCPVTDGVTLLRIESFVELWSDDRVTNRTLLTASEGESANALVGAQWRRVGEPNPRPGV